MAEVYDLQNSKCIKLSLYSSAFPSSTSLYISISILHHSISLYIYSTSLYITQHLSTTSSSMTFSSLQHSSPQPNPATRAPPIDSDNFNWHSHIISHKIFESNRDRSPDYWFQLFLSGWGWPQVQKAEKTWNKKHCTKKQCKRNIATTKNALKQRKEKITDVTIMEGLTLS